MSGQTRAIYRMITVEKGLALHRYWPSACPRCPLKARCTPRRTIEHVLGTLKHWMGSTHFLTRGLQRVGTEMALHVSTELES